MLKTIPNQYSTLKEGKQLIFNANKIKQNKKERVSGNIWPKISLSLTLYQIKPLSANPQKWANTLKQIVGNSSLFECV